MPKKLPKRFTDEAAARAHLEAIQWPDGPVCPHCGVVDRASKIAGGRAGLWFCNTCRCQFSVTVGTIMERSHIPLHTWLYATLLLCSSKKGISSHQLSRMLGVSYKSAWFMAHRLREAMKPAAVEPLGGTGKVVEADETYLLKQSGKRKAPGAGGYAHKMKVLSLVERGGKMRSFKLRDGTKSEIVAAMQKHVRPDSTLHTDGAQVYKYLDLPAPTGVVAKRESVDHIKEFVRGDVHTNTAEGVFSIFKRGMVGTYQHCGEQHLQRYLAEFDFRANHRVKLGYSDDMRTDKALEGIRGKRLTYRISNKAGNHPSEGGGIPSLA